MREHNITCRPRLNEKDRGVLFVVSRGCDSFGQQHYMDNRHGASLKCPQSRIQSPWALWLAGGRQA